jgi:UDP-N-acetylglucosamine 2-epimerase (non-hydrolysing)
MSSWTFIYGTRPEAIKLSPLVLSARKAGVQVEVLITGQHRTMLQQANELFGIHADKDLRIMKMDQHLNDVMIKSFSGIHKFLFARKPSLVFIQGDTTTALSAALVSFNLKIPIVHIEAGLRSWSLEEPFPEEGNRLLISQIASFHFAPTSEAKKNLKVNGITKHVYISGNTVVDALKIITKKIPLFKNDLVKKFPFIGSKEFILLTCHRRESFGESLKSIFRAVKKISIEYNFDVIFPIHLNPLVRSAAKEELSNHPNIHIIEPVDYLSLVYLMKNCKFVMTDSGGIQEEAPVFGKPVFILRNKTERNEAVRAGCSMVVGNNENVIYRKVTSVLINKSKFTSMSIKKSPYGDGNSSKFIVSKLIKLNEKN